MIIPFHKYQGAGNDFVLIDNRSNRYELNSQDIAALCHRKFGVGADGLILLKHGDQEVDFSIHYFNSDGSEASFCGNGTRCAVAFAHNLQMISETCRLQAYDGIHTATILEHYFQQYIIALKMNDVDKIIQYDIGFFLDTGSPHLVVFLKDDIAGFDVVKEGKKLRNDPQFPDGCNVNFVQCYRDGIYGRTYERGVEDETLSCGTGVTASALVWALKNDSPDGTHIINVYTQGGNFKIEFTKIGQRFSDIKLVGEAIDVFEGTFTMIHK
jgi:diaminopimelate epimerase